MKADYTSDIEMQIDHVSSTVGELNRSLEFYCGLLGFSLVTIFGVDATLISSGSCHPCIGLNAWYGKKSTPSAPSWHTGLRATTLCPIRDRLGLSLGVIPGVSFH